MQVSETIKEAAQRLDCLYLRATPSEANEEIERTAMKGLTLVIYTNFPSVDFKLDPLIKATYPVEIQVLKLASYDDNTRDSDVYIDGCRDIALKLALDILNTTPAIIYPEDINTETFDSVQIYDDILTGVTLSFNLEFQINC